MSDQHCPICGSAVEPNLRYPNYVCGTCLGRAVSGDGRAVGFTNVGPYGDAALVDRATGEVIRDQACVIDGTHCWAEQARFGGVVVQPLAGRP